MGTVERLLNIFFFQAEDGIRDLTVTGVQTCALPISLPLVRRLEVEGRRVLLCHGSPRKINEFVWESASPDQFLEYLLDQAGADVVCVTHTGIKWHRRLLGGRRFVNVGVLGRPENDGNTNVWYTLLSFDGAEVGVEFVPVVYDFPGLASDMRNASLP